MDLASELLKNGWAKLKELKRDPTDEDLRKKELESEARSAGKGVWNPHGPKVSIAALCCADGPLPTVVVTGTHDALHDAHGLAGFHQRMERPAD